MATSKYKPLVVVVVLAVAVVFVQHSIPLANKVVEEVEKKSHKVKKRVT